MDTKRNCPNCGKPLAADVPLGLCPECLIKSGFPTGTEPGQTEKLRFVAPLPAELASRFPQLEIISLIGQGGMGAVYKARQAALDRFVALKILPPQISSEPGFSERFTREARALARLNHPNIVAVYEFGHAGGQPYLVMEYIDGLNLREVERAGRLQPGQALKIVPQICEALEFAHQEGIVHRDIKPENILIDKKGRVKITDFGIAKILGVSEGNISLTGAKDSMGTPHYMAPEQVERPKTVDHRADIYSLGVVFYELLTGELPLGKFQPPSRKVQIDVRLDDVVLQALEKEPERRYQHASQIKADVENITRTPAPPMEAPSASGALSSDERKRLESYERRRKYLLWYGMLVCGVIGLPVGIAWKQPVLLLVSALGLVVGGIKLRRMWSRSRLPDKPAESTGPDPLWHLTGALTVVWFFAVLTLNVVVLYALRVPGRWVVPLTAVLVLSIPFAAIGMHRLSGVWRYGEAARRTRAQQWLKAFSWVGLGVFALFFGFGLFFLMAVFGESGSWNPAVDEAIIVPLIWIGSLLLAIALRVLFAAAAGFEALKNVRPSRVALGAVLSLLIVAGLVIYAGPVRAHRAAGYSTRIHGKVVDADTGAPIANARVDDNSYGAGPNRVPRHTWTDAQGNYALLTSREEHTIAASAPGYRPSTTVLLTTLLGNPTITNMDFRLHRGESRAAILDATVSSRKAVIRGQNLADSRITLSIGDSENNVSCGFVQNGEFTAEVQADSEGVFFSVRDHDGTSLLSQRTRRVGVESISSGSVKFFEGTVTPDDEGSVTVGEFRPTHGHSKLIRVKLSKP